MKSQKPTVAWSVQPKFGEDSAQLMLSHAWAEDVEDWERQVKQLDFDKADGHFLLRAEYGM